MKNKVQTHALEILCHHGFTLGGLLDKIKIIENYLISRRLLLFGRYEGINVEIPHPEIYRVLDSFYGTSQKQKDETPLPIPRFSEAELEKLIEILWNTALDLKKKRQQKQTKKEVKKQTTATRKAWLF